MNVLIVDDSALFRARLVSVVAEMGEIESVVEAGDVPAALAAIRSGRPDVILLDIEMPGGDSLQVLELAQSSNKDMPVIVLTAFPFAQYRRRFLEAGASHFLDKATEFDRVIVVLQELRTARMSGSLPPS